MTYPPIERPLEQGVQRGAADEEISVTAEFATRNIGCVMPATPDTEGAEDGEARLLVRAACAGDDAAWESLYRSIYPRLRAYFVRRVGPVHADDGVSETMTRAVAAINRFTWTDAGFDGWLFGIARHVAVDHHRRQERQRRYGHVGRLFSNTPPDDGNEPVDHAMVADDDHALIRRLFARLTEPEREILELRVIAGLSAAQVGAVLGQKPGAVRTAQSRALAHLRALMAEHDV